MTRAPVIALLACLTLAPAADAQDTAPNRPYLAAAIQAANWLETLEIAPAPDGPLAWPTVEGEADVSTNLYSGTPGVILCYIALHEATGGETHLDRAKRGADDLLSKLPDRAAPTQCGLYTGIAGQGYVLLELARASGDERYEQGARRCLDLVIDAAEPTESGARFGPVYDIISGSAGIGLFLLYAERELDDPRAGNLAKRIGDDLLAHEQPIDGHPDQATFLWRDGAEREMPNFSHGAAGIAYFLAELHQTQVGSAQASSPYLAGARRAARYLQSLSRDPCLVHHHTPGGENLYYLGYCHGPPGAARLFMTLHEIEPDAGWDAWLTRSADAILDTGIPDQSPGFWNNVGQCCGSAGLASFMLEMHRRTGDRKYMNAVRALTDDLLARATREETSDGRPTLKWIHAEHRIRPDFLQAQTGYMQGAAGIALWLLELDAHDNAQAARPPQLPDSPF